MKKFTSFLIFIFFFFCCPLFSEKYIKEQSFSYQYEKEPVCTIESLYTFDDFNFLKSFERQIRRGKQITTYNYNFEHTNDVYIIKLEKKNDYISSKPNISDTYTLSKMNGKWTFFYEDQILGYFIYSKKDKKISFLDYEANEEEVFYEQKNGSHILYFNLPYKYSLRNNIFYNESLASDIKTKISYDFKNEKYNIIKNEEGLESESIFTRDYYCTDFKQICLMWIVRYDFGGELLPYIFCKLDRAYHSTSYLTEGSTTYEPEHLQQKDGLPWASGNGFGIGDVISIKEFEHKNPTTLKIMNGYQDPNHPDYYEKNTRVKKIKVTNTDTQKSKSLIVKDIKNEQTLDISDLGKGRNYDIEIQEVYEGNKYKDLCIQYLVVE